MSNGWYIRSLGLRNFALNERRYDSAKSLKDNKTLRRRGPRVPRKLGGGTLEPGDFDESANVKPKKSSSTAQLTWNSRVFSPLADRPRGLRAAEVEATMELLLEPSFYQRFAPSTHLRIPRARRDGGPTYKI